MSEIRRLPPNIYINQPQNAESLLKLEMPPIQLREPVGTSSLYNATCGESSACSVQAVTAIALAVLGHLCDSGTVEYVQLNGVTVRLEDVLNRGVDGVIAQAQDVVDAEIVDSADLTVSNRWLDWAADVEDSADCDVLVGSDRDFLKHLRGSGG